jgi:hypothetical protein
MRWFSDLFSILGLLITSVLLNSERMGPLSSTPSTLGYSPPINPVISCITGGTRVFLPVAVKPT